MTHAATDRRNDPSPARCGRSIFWRGGLFFFFSNRLGCLGSIAISLLLSLVLLHFLGWI